VLALEPKDDIVPTSGEEANLLANVFQEMHSLGYDASNLEMISTWLQNSEL
jgi:hypothetical protein